MKLQKCFWCDKITATPYHVTEIDGKNIESFDMCIRCAEEYFKDFNKPKPEKGVEVEADLTSIKTPEDLLAFIDMFSSQEPKTKMSDKEPCQCGLTVEELESKGRFGCVQCYEHFSEFMEKMVFPFHGGDQHVGKRPKKQMQRQMEEDPVEKMKLLKLRYAKALELEEYEQAAVIHEEIQQLSQSLSSSGDQ